MKCIFKGIPSTFPYFVFCILYFVLSPITLLHSATPLPGFTQSPYHEEQVATFDLVPDIRIHINAPSAEAFDPEKPVGLALYALPNGNTIEHTVGKVIEEGDDWHFDIQHIGAQTRFLRSSIDSYNLVTVYLEAEQLSWPTWKSQYPNYADIVEQTVLYLKSYFGDYDPFVVLTGHSGGGRFIFSFMDADEDIPDYVDRICFLDSNYGYENTYGDQMINWLNGAEDRYLSVLAYNDSVALYNGQPIVSPTGGTWYRTRMMQKYFAGFYTFETVEDDTFIRHEALDGRIKILLKKNPEQKILHTVQVEKNGFIHTMLTGTVLEENGYSYYGERSYGELIQEGVLPEPTVKIPLRNPQAMTGSQFMNSVIDMSFADREESILQELRTGNVPYFLRELVLIEATYQDAAGNNHDVRFRVMPDYLAIGSDEDFCRVPMGPITAQKAADFYGTCMPTRKLVDEIYVNAEVKLAPVTYYPVGNQNESVAKFIEHNEAIEAQRAAAGAIPGQLVGGIKKDVVLSNKITDPSRTHHVTIYGWHTLDGNPIQPLYNGHFDTYVDYSHGIRYLDDDIEIDGGMQDVRSVLTDGNLYKILSDETGPMAQPTYIADSNLPEKPSSFGVVSDEEGTLTVMINPDPSADRYRMYLSDDGITFNEPVIINSGTHALSGLSPDSIVYIKLRAENDAGMSQESEVLAGYPGTSSRERMLIVNGFDRTSDGNTFDFVRQHGQSAVHAGTSFDSATNDAVIDGILDLEAYPVVDYILGEESTADETFSNTEQALVASFLKQGGRLFVSGAEIAWDLDYRGTSSDKSFFNNYLKADYSADAPGGVSGTYYTARGVEGGIFDSLTSISFDNGSHGTYDVEWADALIPLNGAKRIVEYKNVSSHKVGGVSFEGAFKDGTEPGKLVYLGFPFETVYPETTRHAMMGAVLEFLYGDVSGRDKPDQIQPVAFTLHQNYPNPFNPVTTIRYQISGGRDREMPVGAYGNTPQQVELTIHNTLGQKITTLVSENQPPGEYTVRWDASGMPSGIYFYKLTTKDQSRKTVINRMTRKMTLLR